MDMPVIYQIDFQPFELGCGPRGRITLEGWMPYPVEDPSGQRRVL